MCQFTARPQPGQAYRFRLPDHGGLSSWAWSNSQRQLSHHRKASVTGPPTCSSSAGRIFGIPIERQRWQRKVAVAKLRSCNAVVASMSIRRVAVAARAVDVQLETTAGDVADRLEWEAL